MKATPEQAEMILDIARNLDKYHTYNRFNKIQVNTEEETIYFEPRAKWTTVTLGRSDYSTTLEVESDELIKLLLDWQEREYSTREVMASEYVSRFLSKFKPVKSSNPALPINS